MKSIVLVLISVVTTLAIMTCKPKDMPTSIQDEWEITSNKFDISTLKPYESKVLVRTTTLDIWKPAFWGKGIHKESGKRVYNYLTTHGFSTYCIPYEGNEHLLGTSNDCNEFFKTWEE